MATEYKELEEILEHAMHALSTVEPPVARNLIAEWVQERPYSEIRAADDACREYVSKKRWPDLDPIVVAQIRLRLEAGVELCRRMASSGETEVITSYDEALELMLILHWHEHGPQWATNDSRFQGQNSDQATFLTE